MHYRPKPRSRISKFNRAYELRTPLAGQARRHRSDNPNVGGDGRIRELNVGYHHLPPQRSSIRFHQHARTFDMAVYLFFTDEDAIAEGYDVVGPFEDELEAFIWGEKQRPDNWRFVIELDKPGAEPPEVLRPLFPQA
jgi:hypothetical protein